MSALASLLVCGAVWVGGSRIDDGVVREVEDSRPAGFNRSVLTVSTRSLN